MHGRKSEVPFFKLIGRAGSIFGHNDPLRMAGATAFFTTFALPAVLLILIQVLGLIFDEKMISSRLFERLTAIIGPHGVEQVSDTLKSMKEISDDWRIVIPGFLFLIFVSTTLMRVIRNSINQLWQIRIHDKRRAIFQLKSRLRSFAILMFSGILFLGGLIAESLQAFLGDNLSELLPKLTPYFKGIFSHLISLVIVTIWFMSVFRYLPDGRPEWKVSLAGALLTSVLFNSGRLIIRWLLSLGDLGNIYGASGSIVLVMLFVFYSSFIIYFGAAFTTAWADHKDLPIKPRPYARKYVLKESRE